MRGNAHVRFGSAGRGNGRSERSTPRPGPILTLPFSSLTSRPTTVPCNGTYTGQAA
jgi:hypothetical protein